MHLEKTLAEDIYMFLLVHKESNRILDGNRLAKNYYYLEEEPPQLMDIFTDVDMIRDPMSNLLEEEGMRLFGILSQKKNGEKFVCDIEMCYTDKSQHLVVLIIKDRGGEDSKAVGEVVELVDNPVVVLDLDKLLTVHYASYKFYHSIRSNKKAFHEEHGGSYLSLFDEVRQVAFGNAVREQLASGTECHAEIEMSYDGQYYHLFHLEGFRSKVDGRLYAVLISIRNQSELLKKIEFDQQYIEIIQGFSKDLLFHIDIEKRMLSHRGDVSEFDGLLPEMPSFPESMMESGLIDPVDKEGYLAFVEQMIHGQGAVYEIRLRMTSGEYENFRLEGKPLFDESGRPVQILGRIENIQKIMEIEENANYDRLTSALSLESFQDLVGHMIGRSVQKDRYAVLTLEFDAFDGLIGEMGQEFADFVLEVAGRRITNSIRNMDKVGRLVDGKFSIFFHYAPNGESVMDRANSILHAVHREFSDGTKKYMVKSSLGVALYPDHGRSLEELLEKSGLALARARYLGSDVAAMYHRDLE